LFLLKLDVINIANIFFTVLIAIFIANTINIYFSLALIIWVILFVIISISLSKDIIHYLNPFVSAKISQISKTNGEPMPMQLGSATGSSTANVVSEKYTYYAGQSEGRGPTNPNYVSATDVNPFSIQTPDETYKPNKLSNGDVTIDILKQKRDTDIPDSLPNPYGF
jgi:hypothetical protein